MHSLTVIMSWLGCRFVLTLGDIIDGNISSEKSLADFEVVLSGFSKVGTVLISFSFKIAEGFFVVFLSLMFKLHVECSDLGYFVSTFFYSCAVGGPYTPPAWKSLSSIAKGNPARKAVHASPILPH